MSDLDPLAAARKLMREGRSDEEIQLETGVSPLELLELRAEQAAGATTLRWIIPNIRAEPAKRRGLFRWLTRG